MLSALQAAVRGEAPVQIRETGLERREEASATTRGSHQHRQCRGDRRPVKTSRASAADLGLGGGGGGEGFGRGQACWGCVVITRGWRGGFMEGGR